MHEQILQALYDVFAAYPRPSTEGFCTYCHDDARIRGWLRTPLRELTGAETRPLLWEAADHWPSVAAYKHFLPRMLEVMAPPLAEAPLYPRHVFETLTAQGFSTWPAREREAVLRALEANAQLAQSADLHEVLRAFGSQPDVVDLASHCKSKLVLPPWASEGGFAGAEWLEADGSYASQPPACDNEYSLRVRGPFAAKSEEPFNVTWVPPLVAYNGWDESNVAALAEMRVVSCLLVAEMERAREGLHERAKLRVKVVSTRDPFVGSAKKQADLNAYLVDASSGVRKQVDRHGERAVVQTSMQGDINFTFYVNLAARTLVLVEDASICQSFLFFGPAALTDEMLARLLARGA